MAGFLKQLTRVVRLL